MLSMLYIQNSFLFFFFLSVPHCVQFTDVLFESARDTSAYFSSRTWRIELFDGKELEETVRPPG